MIRSFMAGIVAIGLCAAMTAMASASTVFELQDTTVTAAQSGPTSGSVNFVVTGANISISGFNAALLINDPNVTITGFTFASPFNADQAAGTAFHDYGGGSYEQDANYTVAKPLGSSSVIGQFNFSIAAGHTGQFQIGWDDPSYSGLTAVGAPSEYSFTPATVTVSQAAEPVPAPLALWGGMALFGLAGLKKWRKGQAA